MRDSHVIKAAEVPPIDRGGGVQTTPLVTIHGIADARFTTGMSIYPPGKGAPLHIHNCDEQVTLLDGEAEVEIDGKVTPLVPYDSTYIPAGRVHAFRNRGDSPMRILWIYSSSRVTRTFVGSTEAVEHLSARDLMG